MSADNGIHIKKDEDNMMWQVYEYSGSHDGMHLIGEKATLEGAIELGEAQGTEYGLSFQL